MKRIRLLHITSSLKIGGAENVLYQLVSSLDSKQFEQHVIYFNEGPYVQKIAQLGVPLYKVSGFFFRYDPLFFISLFIAVIRIKPHCIHTLLWVANVCGRVIAWLLRISCISAFHNNIEQDGFVRNRIDRITLRCADKLIAVSEEVAQSVYRQHSWLPANAITLITNGIRQYEHHTSVTKEQLSIPEDAFIVGAVGRLEPVKNYGLLLESFAQLQVLLDGAARLIIVGDGSERMKLIAHAKALAIDDKVIFTGQRNSHDYYPLFDCFVMTSDKEGISIALLEAMSYARTCIVTNVSEKHSVLVDRVNGLIVPAGNKEILVQSLFDLSKNGVMRSSLGTCAQQTVQQHFCATRMIDQYSDLFKRSASS